MMLLKALYLGHPDSMLETLRLHSELIYHPSPAVLAKYFEHYKSGPYEGLKTFFKALRGNYLLVLPSGFHATLIEKAAANNDKKTAKFAYIDILDYQNAGLTSDHLSIVFDTFDYDLAIDHVLASHIGSTAVKLGVSNNSALKMHQALYYYRVKGYLSAVDILKEITA